MLRVGLGDQLNESIFLPPFSVIFEQSKTFNFWEFVEFFLLILSGWMIGVFATHYYYFGFASLRKLGYKEVPMNDISSDEEGIGLPQSIMNRHTFIPIIFLHSLNL